MDWKKKAKNEETTMESLSSSQGSEPNTITPSHAMRIDSLSEFTNILATSMLQYDRLNIVTKKELGRGNNGIVYEAISEYFNGQFVVKSTRLKKKDINFYCTSIVNSIEINAIFPQCSNLIICSYGIIANKKNIDLILEPTRRLLIEHNLLFIAEDIDDSQIFLLFEYIKGETLRERIDSGYEIDDFEKYAYQILETLVLLQNYYLVPTIL
jgi:serine/threonine protein kinase